MAVTTKKKKHTKKGTLGCVVKLFQCTCCDFM